jgi:hypothetical protein
MGQQVCQQVWGCDAGGAGGVGRGVKLELNVIDAGDRVERAARVHDPRQRH